MNEINEKKILNRYNIAKYTEEKHRGYDIIS